MTQLSKAAFLAKYNDTGTGLYRSGQGTGAIDSTDHQTNITDIDDSCLFLSDHFIDEDSFASDSATKAPSQQSTKAYILSSSVPKVTSTDEAIVRFDSTAGAVQNSTTSTLSDTGIRNTTGSHFKFYEASVYTTLASTSSNFNVGLLANGDSITITVVVAGKDDSSNTGFGGQYIVTWTRSGGTMQLVAETGATISNIDTGGTFTFSSSDSGAAGVTITGTIGGGTGNASWASVVSYIQFVA